MSTERKTIVFNSQGETLASLSEEEMTRWWPLLADLINVLKRHDARVEEAERARIADYLGRDPELLKADMDEMYQRRSEEAEKS